MPVEQSDTNRVQQLLDALRWDAPLTERFIMKEHFAAHREAAEQRGDAAGYDNAQLAEVVAWLRTLTHINAEYFADAIERREHLP